MNIQFKKFSVFLASFLLVVNLSDNVKSNPDIAPELTRNSSNKEIAEHLNWHEEKRLTTTALADLFPDMDRKRGYDIQHLRMTEREMHDPVVGWKLGFSRKAEADYVLDTVFAPVHSSLVYSNEKPLDTSLFVEGRPALEPEVIISLKSDLIKNGNNAFTREQVKNAIDWVGTGIEFGASRLRPAGDDKPVLRTHLVTDNISNAGVILPTTRKNIDDVNWDEAVGTLIINGEIKAQGHAKYIMGVDPLEGVVWLANELDKFGYQLKAGQFIVTGSVDTPAPSVAEDKAEVTFKGIGTTQVEFTAQ